MSIREQYPNFIKNEAQLIYYYDIHDRLVRNGVDLTEQDAYSLGTLAINCWHLDNANADIAEKGSVITIQTERGESQRVNPYIHVLKEAQQNLRHYFKQFKMTPSDREAVLAKGDTETVVKGKTFGQI